MDPLHDKLAVIISHCDNALHAQDVRAVTLSGVLNPGDEPGGIHWLVGHQRQAGNLVVVLVSMLLGEESRLDLEDAIEIESVSPQYLGEVEAAALRSVNGRIGIDLAYPAFDRR